MVALLPLRLPPLPLAGLSSGDAPDADWVLESPARPCPSVGCVESSPSPDRIVEAEPLGPEDIERPKLGGPLG